MKLWFLLLFSTTNFALQQTAQAAACCGGGFAAPSIIAGDDKAQLTSSYSMTEVTVDHVDANGVWHKWDTHQQVQTIRIEGAHLVSDRWQAGFALPIVQRSRLEQSYSGLGDIALSLGYEYLPDWDYNPLRPKGIGFVQLTLPTGKSKAESDLGGLDSRGNGFWSIGIGTLLTKTFGKYDAFSSIELHNSFAKDFSNSQMQGTLKPGVGGNFGVGGGYNLESLRFGASLLWSYEDPVDIKSSSPSSGSAERSASLTLSANYLANDDWAGTLSYSDQTLIGSPVNTSLGQTLSLIIQRRWAR